MKSTAEIREFIRERLEHLRKLGAESTVLLSGDIHREMGLSDRKPMVSKAMFQVKSLGDQVVHTTPSDQSSTIKIRYFLV